MEETVATTGGDPKLKKAYDYLKSKEVVVPENYAEFETAMQDDEKLSKLYDYFKSEQVEVPGKYDDFKVGMLADVKKKDVSQPGSPNSGALSDSEIAQAVDFAPEEGLSVYPDKNMPTNQAEQDRLIAAELGKQTPALSKFDDSFISTEKTADAGLVEDPHFVGAVPEGFYAGKNGQMVPVEQQQESTVPFLESIKNTGENIGTRLQGAIPRLNIVAADVWENVLGKELADKWYDLEGRDIEQVRNDAYKKLAVLDTQVKATNGVVNSLKRGDAAGLASALVDAVGQVAATAIPSFLTGGAGLYTETVGESIVNYNKAKAKNLGIPIEKLYASGQAELGVPATIGTISGAMEGIGLKGISNAINAKIASKGLRAAAELFKEVNKEGATEWVQVGLDEVNDAIGAGKTMAQAVTQAADSMFSEKGLEAYAKGLAGSAGAASVGRAANFAVENVKPEQISDSQVFLPDGELPPVNTEMAALEEQVRRNSQVYKNSATPGNKTKLDASVEKLANFKRTEIPQSKTVAPAGNELAGMREEVVADLQQAQQVAATSADPQTDLVVADLKTELQEIDAKTEANQQPAGETIEAGTTVELPVNPTVPSQPNTADNPGTESDIIEPATEVPVTEGSSEPVDEVVENGIVLKEKTDPIPPNKTKVFRGTGRNVAYGDNNSVSWVATDKRVAENYTKNNKIDEIEVEIPSNPFEIPFNSVYVKGSDIGNRLKAIRDQLFRQKKLGKLDYMLATVTIDDFVSKSNETPELYSTKTNKSESVDVFVNALKLLGFDGLIQKEAYNSSSPFSPTKTGEESITYGIFKNDKPHETVSETPKNSEPVKTETPKTNPTENSLAARVTEVNQGLNQTTKAGKPHKKAQYKAQKDLAKLRTDAEAAGLQLVEGKNGRWQLKTKEGKVVTYKSGVPNTSEVENFVGLDERSPEVQTVANKMIEQAQDNPKALMGLGLGITQKEVKGVLNDLATGRNTERANRVLELAETATKQGGFDMTEGSGLTIRKFFVPLADFMAVETSGKSEVESVVDDAEMDDLIINNPTVRNVVENPEFANEDGSVNWETLSEKINTQEDWFTGIFPYSLTDAELETLKQIVNERTNKETGKDNGAEAENLPGTGKPGTGSQTPDSGTGKAEPAAEAVNPRDAILAKRQAIKDRIKQKSQGRANALPVDLIADYVELGITYIQEGVLDLKDFAARLQADHSEIFGEAEPLTDDEIQQVYSEAGGSVPPVGNGVETEPANNGKEVKKTVATFRAYEGAFREEVKSKLEQLGLTREVESQKEAKAKAKEFIALVGENAALEAVRNRDVRDAAGAYVWNELIESTEAKLAEQNTPERQTELESLQAQLIDELSREALSGGRFASALGDIYENSDLGYNLARKIQQWKDKNGGEISPEVEAKFRELDAELKAVKERLAEAEKRAEEAEANAAIADIQESITRDSKKTYKQKAKTVADNFRKLKVKAFDLYDSNGNKIQTLNSGLNWNDLVELGAKAIELTGEIADGVKAITDKISKEKWFKNLSDKDKKAVLEQVSGLLDDSKGVELTDNGNIPRSVIRDLVAGGIDNINDLVAALQKEFPDMSAREIRDLVTGYGKTANPSKDIIDTQIRKMKRLGRAISALEDIQNKKRPLRSGIQRDKLDAEERALQKEIRELMKDLPADEATRNNELKTQLDAAKTRIKNHIEDLNREISTGQRTERSNRTIQKDAELQALIDERDALKKIHDDLFAKNGVSAETKLANAIRATERAIEDYEQRIKSGDVFPAKKGAAVTETPELKTLRDKRDALKAEIKRLQDLDVSRREESATRSALRATERAITDIERKIAANELGRSKKPSLVQNTPEIIAAKERLKIQKKLLKQMRDDAGVTEKFRNETAKKAAQRKIDDLNRRLAKGDFSKKVNKPVVADSELIKLRAEKLRIQEEYDKEFYKNELKNRTVTEKVKDALWETWGLTRALMATGEFSFIGVQGLVQAVAHPQTAVKGFKNSLRFLTSERRAENWLREIKAQSWYPVLKDSNLAITEPNAKITASEELFYSGWTNVLWNTIGRPFKLKSPEAYNKWVAANPFRALERAAVGYLDTVRVERFLDGMALLEGKRMSYASNPQDYKDVADAINTLTGRASLGKLEQISPQLAKIFFSPRNWASGIKTATPYGLYHFGKMTPTARKMAISDFSRFVGATAALVAMSAAYLNNDDDDETGVELDPRSSDYGKIKIGETRIDPWGGRIQMITMQARLIMDSIKDGKGEIKQLGSGFNTPTKGEVLLRMATNKLAPSAAIAAKYFSSTVDADGQRVVYGEPYSLSEELTGSLVPIYWGTINDLLKSEGNGALDGVLAFASFFGLGVNVYDHKKPVFARSGDKAINALGEEVSDDAKPTEQAQKVWEFLESSKIEMTKPAKSSLPIFDEKLGEERLMTGEEFYDFCKIRGQYIKEDIAKDLNYLKTLSPDELKDEIKLIKSNATSDAKYEIEERGYAKK